MAACFWTTKIRATEECDAGGCSGLGTDILSPAYLAVDACGGSTFLEDGSIGTWSGAGLQFTYAILPEPEWLSIEVTYDFDSPSTDVTLSSLAIGMSAYDGHTGYNADGLFTLPDTVIPAGTTVICLKFDRSAVPWPTSALVGEPLYSYGWYGGINYGNTYTGNQWRVLSIKIVTSTGGHPMTAA